MWLRSIVTVALVAASGVSVAEKGVTEQARLLIEDRVDAFDPTSDFRKQCKELSKAMYPAYRDLGKSPQAQFNEFFGGKDAPNLKMPVVCGGYHALKALDFAAPYGYHAQSAYAFYDLLGNDRIEYSSSAFLRIALAQNQKDLDAALIEMHEMEKFDTEETDKVYLMAKLLYEKKKTFVDRNITALLSYPADVFLHEGFDRKTTFTVGGEQYTHGDVLDAYHKKIEKVNEIRIQSLISTGTYSMILDDDGYVHYFAIVPDPNTFESYVFDQAQIKAANTSNNFETKMNAIAGLQHVRENHPWAYSGQFLISLMGVEVKPKGQFYME